ncbi:hypothetical protein D3C72_1300400 [compost metagenome]
MESRELYKNIGNNLDLIRREKKMTISEFSQYIHASSTQLVNVIKGERGFSIRKLLEISEITNYPIEFILIGKKTIVEDDIKLKLETANNLIKEANEMLSTVNNII